MFLSLWMHPWSESEIIVAICMCYQAAIRKELNEFKSAEMEVHEESKKYTRYIPLMLLLITRQKVV